MARRLVAVTLLWAVVVTVILLVDRDDDAFLIALAINLGVCGAAVGLLLVRDRLAPGFLAHRQRRDARALGILAGFIALLCAGGLVVAAIRAAS